MGLLDRAMGLGLRYVRRSPRLRTLARSRLRAMLETRIDLADYPLFDSFTDRAGRTFELHQGLRGFLRPSWRTSSAPGLTLPTEKALRPRIIEARDSVRRMAALAETFGGAWRDGRVVEIGCFDGLRTHALAECGASRAVGTDIAAYYVRQGVDDDRTDADRVTEATRYLGDLRALGGSLMGPRAGSVEFVEDDLAASTLADSSFDALVSFEVLEHLFDPRAAFRQVARILAPGGLALHSYNPFFALLGGHSLCTLDFLWGHARIDGEDFDAYVERFRPDEVGPATRFFHRSLNRMTLALLRDLAHEVGLETLAVVPSVGRGHASMVTREILEQVRTLHPTATLLDLIAPEVLVVQRRPS